MDKDKNGVKTCTACLRDNENSEATHWCCDCTESLCDNCGKVHKRSRFTTTHKLLRLEDIKNTKSFLLTTSFLCDTHPNFKFTFYCRKHDQLLCHNCLLQTHKDCRDLQTLDQTMPQRPNSNKQNDELSTVLQQATKLSQALELVINQRNENLVTLNSQKKTIQETIKKMREEIEKHLSKLESDLLISLNVKHDSCKQQIEDELSELRQNKELMDINENDIQLVRNYGSDSYRFAIVKKFEQIKTKTEDMLSYFHEKNKPLELEFTRNETQISSMYSSFGWVDIKVLPNETPVTMSSNTTPRPLSKLNDNGFTTKRSRPPSSMSEQLITMDLRSSASRTEYRKLPATIDFSTQTKTHISLCSYSNFQVATALGESIAVSRGCFLPSRHLLLCDSKNRCMYKMTLSGVIADRISLLYIPHDVALFDKFKVVVCAGVRGIQIVSVRDGECKPDRVIKPGGKCTTVACIDEQIIVRNGSCKICIMDIYGNLILKINTKYDPFFITANVLESIYWTSNNSDDVQCIAAERSQYVYKPDNLIGPTGLAADDKGHVFVAGYESNNIHCLSTKGSRSVVVSESINHPWDLDFDRDSKNLMVIYNGGKSVAIYTVGE